MKYMVTETFKPGKADEVYARFAEKGRMLPDGLRYITSWLSSDRGTCFQLMEADSTERFDEWTRRWDDLVDFKVTPVVDSPTASTSEINRTIPVGSRRMSPVGAGRKLTHLAGAD